MEKIKYTIYLPQSTLEILDGIWLEMRSAFKSRQITKSLLLEVAFEVAAKELQEHGTDSKYYDALADTIGHSFSCGDVHKDLGLKDKDPQDLHFWRKK